MLPPIAQSLPPVTAQNDVNKPRPVTAAVTPAAAPAKESALNLDKRHPQDVHERWQEEQRRRQRETLAGTLETDESIAQMPESLIDDEVPRQGVWVDIEV